MPMPEFAGNVEKPSPFHTVSVKVVSLLHDYNPEAAMRLQKRLEGGDVVFGHSPPVPSSEKLPDSPSGENIQIAYPLGLRLDLAPHDPMQRRVHAHLFKAEASREPTGFTRLRTITTGIGFVACDSSAGYQLVAVHNTQLIEYGNTNEPPEELYRSQESRIPMDPQQAAARFYEGLGSYLEDISSREPKLFETMY